MKKIISIVNQKQGAGKTATAVNTAVCLGLMEKPTLLVDCDPQGDAGACLGVAPEQTPGSGLYQALIGRRKLSDLTVSTSFDFLKLVPAGIDLFAAESEAAVVAGREKLLGTLLSGVADTDYIVLDTPSSLGFLTVSAMAAAHVVVVPVRCEKDALVHLGYLLSAVARVRKNLNPGLKIAAVVFTRCSGMEEVYAHLDAAALKNMSSSVHMATVARFDGLTGPAAAANIMAKISEDYFDLAARLIQG
ncbi:MAG: ParA family protein [Thermodesulfobacteriota bacterium]